ncbi:MAG: hypothetical protein K1W33_04925 [Clostridia bacterium]
MEGTQVLEIDRYERGTIINALNQFRNNLIKEGIATESVDELLLKVMDAPIKKRSLVLGRAVKGSYAR